MSTVRECGWLLARIDFGGTLLGAGRRFLWFCGGSSSSLNNDNFA